METMSIKGELIRAAMESESPEVQEKALRFLLKWHLQEDVNEVVDFVLCHDAETGLHILEDHFETVSYTEDYDYDDNGVGFDDIW